MTLVLALRGAAAVMVLTVLAGGVPRIVSAALAVAVGLWSALAVAPVTGPLVGDATWQLAVHELAIGATLGVLAALPLLAAATAGRLVDLADRGAPGGGPYSALFGVLAAAVFVGIDGHIAVIETIVDSHRTMPVLDHGVLAALGHLIPAAVRLAVPWLITAAVVQIAAGVGTRLATRAASHVPGAAAVPAALVMMTASLVATFAVAIAALVRGGL
jgi:flagellar biosynthesis protein FliR